MKNLIQYVILALAAIFLVGCTSYTTPGGGAELSSLTEASVTDSDIQSVLDRKPASPFPARLAVVRIQAPRYRNYHLESYGYGRYSVVTTRDIESDKHFEQLNRLPMISTVVPLNQILMPEKLESDKELRAAAAHLHTDLLLVYTLNTMCRNWSRGIYLSNSWHSWFVMSYRAVGLVE